jgi:hypothetical protein
MSVTGSERRSIVFPSLFLLGGVAGAVLVSVLRAHATLGRHR